MQMVTGPRHDDVHRIRLPIEHTTFASPRRSCRITSSTFSSSEALALAVVRGVPRDEIFDHRAQRGRLKGGVRDRDRLCGLFLGR
jgi:hypothetical protein